MNEYIHSYLNCLQSFPNDLQSFISYYLESDISYQYLLKDSMNLCSNLKSNDISNVDEILDKISYKFIKMQEICDSRYSKFKEVEDIFENLADKISESHRQMNEVYSDSRAHKGENRKTKQDERVAELESALKRIISQILSPNNSNTPSRKNDRDVSEEDYFEDKQDNPSASKTPHQREKIYSRKLTPKRDEILKNRRNSITKQISQDNDHPDSRDESSVNEDDRRTAKEDEESFKDDNSDCGSAVSDRRHNSKFSSNTSSNPLKRKLSVKKKEKLPIKKFHRHSFHPQTAQRPKNDNTSESDDRLDSPDEKLYCLCKKVSYGDMIACDNDNCRFEWFHFACVDVKVQPKGKWFCPDCRTNSNELTSTPHRMPRRNI